MPDFSTLTPRQREIYDFIKEKIESAVTDRPCARSVWRSTSSRPTG